jgi:hypothetical protein
VRNQDTKRLRPLVYSSPPRIVHRVRMLDKSVKKLDRVEEHKRQAKELEREAAELKGKVELQLHLHSYRICG